MPDPNNDTKRAYESPDPDRPASAEPTERDLEIEAPTIRKLDYSPAPAAHDPYAALRFPNFWFFVMGWFISLIGMFMQSTAMGWEIYDRTRDELALGWVALIQVIPLFALSLPAGKLADSIDRRWLIGISAGLASFCSMGLAALSYKPDSIPYMYALLGLNAAFLVIGRPARSSLMPLIVPTHAFSNAVTWNASLFQISAMIGPAMAGKIVEWSLRSRNDVSWAYSIDAVCSLIFAASMLFVKPRKVQQTETADRSLLAGLRFVWRTKIILGTLTLDLFAVLLGGAVWLLPVYATDILKVGPSGLGLLRASESVGALITTLIVAHLPPMKHAGRTMLLSVAGFGIAIIVFGLSKNFWLSFVMLALTGAFDSISVIVRHTLVQVLTPDSVRGQVSAVNNVFIGASNELGGVESTAAAALFGPVKSVVFGGIGCLVTVATIWITFPAIRKYGSLQQEHENAKA